MVRSESFCASTPVPASARVLIELHKQVVCLGLLRPADGWRFSEAVAETLCVAGPELAATAGAMLKRHVRQGPGRVTTGRGASVEAWGDGMEAWAYVLAGLCRVPDMHLAVTAAGPGHLGDAGAGGAGEDGAAGEWRRAREGNRATRGGIGARGWGGNKMT